MKRLFSSKRSRHRGEKKKSRLSHRKGDLDFPIGDDPMVYLDDTYDGWYFNVGTNKWEKTNQVKYVSFWRNICTKCFT